MKLTVLGKDGPYPVANGGTSAYLLDDGEEKIAFEFGAGAYSEISSVVDINSVSALILSHFHFDHCSDVGVLGYAVNIFIADGRRKGKLKIYCPDDDGALSAAIKSIGAFDILPVKDGDEVMIGKLRFRFYAVKHPVKCLGFTAFDGQKTFAHGGDTNECENIDKMLENADFAMLDGGLLERDWSESKPHLSVKRCAEHAAKFGVKTLITHLNPAYTVEEMRAEADEVYGGCMFAEKGKTYNI